MAFLLLGISVAFFFHPLARPEEAPPPRSLNQYIAELDHLSDGLQPAFKDSAAAEKLAQSLPENWDVQAGSQSFTISTAWIKGKLKEETTKPSHELEDSLRLYLAALRRDAAAFPPAPPDYASSRTKLNAILSRYEFRHVRGPSRWDLLKERIGNAIVGLLDRIFGYSKYPVIGKYLVWTMVGLAVLVLAYWIFRILRSSARYESIIPPSLPVSAKQWAVWMAEAQAAAQQAHWREAIHLAYWAGISFLEERGTWRPDRARTPREYLRLLSPGSEYQAPLTTLTREFEVIWYGYKEADQESFAQTLVHLENLGCRNSH
ncbi:MAG: DUF4129 domain-containing protein [Acidobacteria bacterium]|nr:DUF4129 domain-containing protein [Acidobacteriota bacterium]